MKHYIPKFFTVISLILIATGVIAQNGVVYSFTFKIDEELTEYFKVENKSKKWLSGYAESEVMPKEILDSIKRQAEEFFTAKLNLPVKLCYHKNKKEKEVGGPGVMGYLEGLPSNTFNSGKEDCPGSSHYIKLDIIISAGGTSVIIGTKKTKLKPQITVWAKVVDENKKEIWDKKITIKNLENLRSETIYQGNTEITRSETLTPFDIYAIYIMGMEELIKE